MLTTSKNAVTLRLDDWAFLSSTPDELNRLLASVDGQVDLSVLPYADIQALYEAGPSVAGLSKFREQIRSGKVGYVMYEHDGLLYLDYGGDWASRIRVDGRNYPLMMRHCFERAVEDHEFDLCRLPSELLPHVPTLREDAMEGSLIPRGMMRCPTSRIPVRNIKVYSGKRYLGVRGFQYGKELERDHDTPYRKDKDWKSVWKVYRCVRALWEPTLGNGGPPFQLQMYALCGSEARRVTAFRSFVGLDFDLDELLLVVGAGDTTLSEELGLAFASEVAARSHDIRPGLWPL